MHIHLGRSHHYCHTQASNSEDRVESVSSPDMKAAAKNNNKRHKHNNYNKGKRSDWGFVTTVYEFSCPSFMSESFTSPHAAVKNVFISHNMKHYNWLISSVP